eukprot:TRINITY_DN53927_c0_g1_i1.p1 TRINITY_DN53927_c0_g1~~TRINITY_DN53927_c0_g1_i1.p1  ORF type:complete len:310 (-),score=26.02 TRINITY_DN53927_c0_g1_i1:516-1445(-)
MTQMSFADRLHEKIVDKDSRVVLGLDPHLHLIGEIDERLGKAPSREAVSEILFDYCSQRAEACSGHIVAVKPQVAFFERLGPAGWEALERLVGFCRSLDLLVISDCKRGDIGSTAVAYADYHLGGEELAPRGLNADAVTVNPFLGVDTLEVFNPYLASGKGVFALLKTSNPGSTVTQNKLLSDGDLPYYQYLGAKLADVANNFVGSSEYSSLGFVVGATHQSEAEELRRLFPTALFLVPGYGAQGAGAADVACCFDEEGNGAIVNASRSILFAHRNAKWSDMTPVEASVCEAVEMKSAINDAIKMRHLH